jgi:probable rRNA maturation factor
MRGPPRQAMIELTATIDVSILCPAWRRVCPTAEELARHAAQNALAYGKEGFEFPPQTVMEVAVSLADDIAQRQLNRDWRRVDRPTNVLAFPAWTPGAPLPPAAPLLLGDVVLAFETVLREAEEQGKPLADHLSHLIVHGVLHLFGYDHVSEAEAAIMESLETSILARLGVPDPYRGTM